MYINASRYFKTKIYTIEDPPEYIIPGVTQVPVLRNENDVQAAHEQVSPYEEPLKASMRSDPDTLMIGEIRDMATANGLAYFFKWFDLSKTTSGFMSSL